MTLLYVTVPCIWGSCYKDVCTRINV